MFFNSILETLLFDTQATIITEVFLWMTAIGFVFAVLLAFLGTGQRFVREAPTLLTSLGILGTFVGIVVGLMHFDPQNIDGSISTLLEGLKTAFITSLAGMGAAIAFKILTTTPIMASRREQIDTTNAGPEDILKAILDQNSRFDQLRLAIAGTEETSLVGQLKLLRSDSIDHHKETLRTLTDVRTAVAGTEETSLVGQFKLLRSDEHDRHRETMRAIGEDRDRHDSFAEKLWKELDAVGEMLSKSATEQMMAALKEVIADFNKNLTEQFGDNFKALDASVQKLVHWQENYRLQLEQMSSQYAQGVAAITQTEASVAHISEESQQIPAAMEKLKAVMLVNQHQLSELGRHLEAFRDMRDKAVEAVPQIREQIEQTVKDVAASVEVASDHYNKLLENSDAYIQKHDTQSQALLEKFVKTTDDGIDKVRVGLESGANEVKTAISTGAQAFGKTVQDLLTDTTNEVTKTVAVASDHYNKLLENSDAYIQKHDTQSQALLEKFVKTTDDGIDKVRVGLESGANEVKTAISTGAQAFGKTVQDLLTDTTKEVTKTVAVASDHYNKLLENSDAYIQKHDTQSQALLEKFVKTTDDGIDKVRVGLESGANEVKTAISTGAQAFGKTVQDLLTDTTKEVTKTVAVASDHYSKLLENSDAYIQKHDAQSQALLEKFVKATSKGIDQVKEGLESSASAVKSAIITGAQEFDNSVQRLQGNLTSTSDQIAAQSEKIREQLQDTFKEVNSHVRVMLATLSDESKSLSQTLKTTGEQVQRDTQSVQAQVAESIKQMQARLESALAEVFKAQAQTMDRAAVGLEEHMKKSIAKTGEGVNIQLSAIDQAMQKEVNRVMNEMGTALAQIAGQFTKDYTKLVSAMQQIVDKQARQK
ncbi:hypothetical protein [Thiocystis violacea]|uniref:hypothetical protein n=1 Tax=Thiocystis violacea TaxID=13725 RepID=UPI0019074619|nr:hypothetical protein [Thiocystis violacea]